MSVAEVFTLLLVGGVSLVGVLVVVLLVWTLVRTPAPSVED